MIWLIVIVTITIGVLAVILYISTDNNEIYVFLGGSSFLLACMILFIIYEAKPVKEPTALDVYRGKTTLEITYRDSVAIDSTVVYKVK